MAYKDFAENLKKYLSSVATYLKGETSITSFDTTINPNLELNAVRNSSSALQIIHLSNAYYDQKAYQRSVEEIYKTPKQYYQEYLKIVEHDLKILSDVSDSIQEQHESVNATSEKSKNLRNISPQLQYKLSKLK